MASGNAWVAQVELICLVFWIANTFSFVFFQINAVQWTIVHLRYPLMMPLLHSAFQCSKVPVELLQIIVHAIRATFYRYLIQGYACVHVFRIKMLTPYLLQQNFMESPRSHIIALQSISATWLPFSTTEVSHH